MTTTISYTAADSLTTAMEDATLKGFAEFIGLDSMHSDDIAEMTAKELQAAAEITEEEAEALLIAISIADEPSLWSAYQVLSAVIA